jgi:hypothetical protein
MEVSVQPSLFEKPAPAVSLECVVLFALGEFQARGHKLAGRELALDRLQGALSRAFIKFGVPQLSDDAAASLLEKLGASVVRIPAYFAKRPFRVTVPPPLASEALTAYHQLNAANS